MLSALSAQTQGQRNDPSHIFPAQRILNNAKREIKIELKTIAIYLDSCFKI